MKTRNHLPLTCGLIGCALLSGCSTPPSHPSPKPQALQIRWQRLVDEKGETCDRCGSTEGATELSVKTLRRALKPLHIAVVLEKNQLSPEAFAQDPLQSNRIWISDKPIEDWLQAKVGTNQCSGACGVSQCRILTVDGKTYDSVPPDLIVKAGLLAAAQLVGTEPVNPWNPLGAWSQGSAACCPAPAADKK